MSGEWVGPVATAIVGLATAGVAWAGARSSQTAAKASAKLGERAETRADFEAITGALRTDLTELRQQVTQEKEHSRHQDHVIAAAVGYVRRLVTQLRQAGIEPPAPPPELRDIDTSA